jgi:hypothetical protein
LPQAAAAGIPDAGLNSAPRIWLLLSGVSINLLLMWNDQRRAGSNLLAGIRSWLADGGRLRWLSALSGE